MMMRLPGEAASIMAGQELVVPRWYTRIIQHRHTYFKPRAIIWDLFGNNELAMASY